MTSLPATLQAYLDQKTSAPRPHIAIAIDATASRQPTWRAAQEIHGEMFSAVRDNAVAIRLLHFGGNGVTAHPWTFNPTELAHMLNDVTCVASLTKWYETLQNIIHDDKNPNALIIIGDSFEEHRRDFDYLLRMFQDVKIPIYAFQEGEDEEASSAFSLMAQTTSGLHLKFDTSSPQRLREILGGIVAFITGGQEALEARQDSPGKTLLLEHLKK